MQFLLLLLIIAMGFLLRLSPVINQGFWFDEAFSFITGREIPFNGIFTNYDPAHPFLYPYFISNWGLINSSPIFLRLPSLVFSLVSIILIFKIAKILHVNKLYPLVCGLLFSFSAFQIDYAWQARMYSLEMLLILLSFYCLLNLLFIKRNFFYVSGFMIFHILGFLVDYSFIWYLFCIDLVFVVWFFAHKNFRKNQNFVFVMKMLLFINLLFTFYLPFFLSNFSAALDNATHIKVPSGNDLVGSVNYFFGIKTLFNNSWPVFDVSFILVCFLMFLFLRIWEKGRDRRSTLFFMVMITFFILPMFIAFILSHYLRSSIFAPRNLLIASLFPIFATGFVVSKFLSFPGWQRVFGFLVLCVLLRLNLNLYLDDVSGSKHDRFAGKAYERSADFIKANAHLKEDYIIFLPEHIHKLFDYYYYGYDKDRYSAQNSYHKSNLPSKPGTYWIITSFPYPEVASWVSKDFMDNFPFKGCLEKGPFAVPGTPIYKCQL